MEKVVERTCLVPSQLESKTQNQMYDQNDHSEYLGHNFTMQDWNRSNTTGFESIENGVGSFKYLSYGSNEYIVLICNNKKEYYNITKQNQPNQWVRPEKIMEIKGQDILKSVSYTACYAYMNDKKYDTSIQISPHSYTGLTVRFPSFIRLRTDKDIDGISRYVSDGEHHLCSDEVVYSMYENSRKLKKLKSETKRDEKTESEFLF